PTGNAWFSEFVYQPLHTGIQDWITSDLGQQVDGWINELAGSYVIGNGVDGTAADPNGGDAGWLLGDGGDGYGYYGDGGDGGWLFGNGGNAGSAAQGYYITGGAGIQEVGAPG